MKKRFLSVLLSICLVGTFAPEVSFAAEMGNVAADSVASADQTDDGDSETVNNSIPSTEAVDPEETESSTEYSKPDATDEAADTEAVVPSTENEEKATETAYSDADASIPEVPETEAVETETEQPDNKISDTKMSEDEESTDETPAEAETDLIDSTGAVSTKTYNIKASNFDIRTLQTYLDNASESQKIVINFGAGTYKITRTIYVHSNTTINLAAKTTLIRSGEGVTCNMLRTAPYGVNYSMDGSDSAAIGGYNMCHDIVINGASNSTSVLDGGDVWSIKPTKEDAGRSNVVNFGHSTNITINNLFLKNSYSAHLIELAGCKDSKITNCQFDGSTSRFDNEEALDDHFEAIQLDICTLDWAGSFRPDKTPCKNIVVSGNTIKNYQRGIGNHHTLAGHHNSGITISNNTITMTDKKMQHKQGIYCIGFDNTTVTGNKITGYTISIHVNLSTGVSVTNNTINDSSDSAIYVNSNSSVNAITGNKIKNAGLSGISIGEKSSAATISNNEITGSEKSAIIVATGNTTDISKNTIHPVKSGYGISVCGAAVKNVTSNVIETPFAGGISLSSGSIANLKSNKITNSKAAGIFITGGTIKTTCEANTITKPKANGIILKGGTVAKVTKNTITSPGQEGINIYDKIKVTEVSSNTIKSPSNHGILISAGTVGAVKSNKISSPKKGSGITLAGGTVANIDSNTITTPKCNGIFISGGSVKSVSSNTISTPKENGILTTGGKVTTKIDKNKITSPVKAGIAAKKGTIKTISGNTITKPKTIGIFGYGAAITTVTKNTITSAGQHGLSLTAGKMTNISSNTIKSSKQNGMNLVKGTITSIKSNKVLSSGSHGISVGDAAVKNIDANTITGTKGHGITIRTKSKIASVKNNKISSHKQCAICLSNGSITTVSGNQITKYKADVNQIYASNGKLSTIRLSADPVTAKAKKLTGKGSAGATVSTRLGTKTYTAKVNKKGTFTIKIPKQKKGTTITLKQLDKNQNSLTTSLKVQ